MECIRIGTRSTPLAYKQALEFKNLVETKTPLRVNLHRVVTTGDKIRNQPLVTFGGKGCFAKELHTLVASGDCDGAVHSLKDLETILPDPIVLGCVFSEEDPREVFITRSEEMLDWDTWTPSTVIGTCSPRRSAFVQAFSAAIVVPLRGAIETRLQSVRNKQVDGTFLALAGLKRLGLWPTDLYLKILPEHPFHPAVGQGMLALTLHKNHPLNTYTHLLNFSDAWERAILGRHLLTLLQGNCSTAAGISFREDGSIHASYAPLGKSLRYTSHLGNDKQKMIERIAHDLLSN